MFSTRMDLTFDLNLDASFADSIRQQHTGVDAQRAITDLEDQVGALYTSCTSATSCYLGLATKCR
ncbi:hypothetical protein MUN84_19365 [Hymenobacter sp. 5516J-16]|uniref:hypothetical protein n=1 Tax=Hymenobacter sp. 5516J-16 TaxID=2932253 RepID=UPI001FD4864C|nr:hypothetical protein [Hymenobacter sp. 5516J-16]UOQ76659.1 hypothetical protein MUN84_19365 [Hymenobacter sp. 5516J-16]